MEVVAALLRAVVGTIVGVFVALGSFFTNGAPTVVNEPPATTAQTTEFPTASTTKPKPLAKPVAKPRGTKAPEPVSGTPSTSQVSATFSTEELNAKARASLVNVLCTTQSSGYFAPISGSGVFIDTRGVILTNAHVAQFFLLRDYPYEDNIQCVIRAGSPAQVLYTAELVYLPPKWIAANATQIAKEVATGTGEDDYAFLRITGSTNPNISAPSSFASLPMKSVVPARGTSVLVAGYPAGFLGGIAITLNLYPSSAVTTVGQLFNFEGSTNVDMFSVGGTVVAQSGSSGGAALAFDGTLRGLIATEVPGETTSERDLRAITLSHIDNSLAAQGKGGITQLLSGDLAAKALDFNTKIAPGLTAQLEAALK